MGRGVRRTVSRLLPRWVMRWYERSVRRVGYFGSYPDWESARAEATGYDSPVILERVRDALLKVRRGEAVYERDSVLFDRIHYSWPLLAGLLWVAAQRGGRLRVVDVGGSLGSSWYQNRDFLSSLREVVWWVVEQESFVSCGRELFEDDHLRFSDDLAGCLEGVRPDVVLLSSVLPYVEDPYRLLGTIVDNGVEFVIIDRTPLREEGEDRIVLQRVPPEIYPASYPAWILSRSRLIRFLSRTYRIVAEFDALAGRIDLGDSQAVDRGFILRRIGGEREETT